MISEKIRDLKERFPELRLREEEPMREHTSFKIGGPAAAMAFPASVEELRDVLGFVKSEGIPYFLMGNGTNLLFADERAELLVIETVSGLTEMRYLGEGVIEAECGVLLSRLASFALEKGLSGLEFAHGIPGTVGGAMAMNAGAYGGEMKDVVSSVLAFGDEGERRYENDVCDFGKRRSRFQESGETVLSARFHLTPGDPERIRDTMAELGARRRASQPLNMPSAGSFFKRPEGGFAGTMIDQCGLKGYTVGGAQVSEKHAGFVVNAGGATFADVMKLKEHIQDTVQTRFGVVLEPEVRIIRREG